MLFQLLLHKLITSISWLNLPLFRFLQLPSTGIVSTGLDQLLKYWLGMWVTPTTLCELPVLVLTTAVKISSVEQTTYYTLSE